MYLSSELNKEQMFNLSVNPTASITFIGIKFWKDLNGCVSWKVLRKGRLLIKSVAFPAAISTDSADRPPVKEALSRTSCALLTSNIGYIMTRSKNGNRILLICFK